MKTALCILIGALSLGAQITDSDSYAVFVPSRYNAQRAWPILYILDPGARGKSAVEIFAKAAEAEGVVVVGSNKSRNGPNEPNYLAIKEMMEDTHKRYNVDDSRIYFAGFSGGSQLALDWALHSPVAGVIA